MPAEKKPAKTVVDAQVDEATTDPKALMTIEFNGETYEFRRRRLNAVEWKTTVQAGKWWPAIEWLLGPAQFNRLVRLNTTEDGWQDTEEEAGAFLAALGVAIGGKA